MGINDRFVDTVIRRLDQIQAEIEAMKESMNTAFVLDADGNLDLDGHRSAHQAMIKAAIAEEQFWTTVRSEATKVGVQGVLGAVKVVFWLACIGLAAKLGLNLGWLK